MKHSRNLFCLPEILPEEEIFESILSGPPVKIERIVSSGQSTPGGTWLEQDIDEWVALLQGSAILEYEDFRKIDLEAGDWVFIPAHSRHRVAFTSSEPPCIWLAVHGKLRQ